MKVLIVNKDGLNEIREVSYIASIGTKIDFVSRFSTVEDVLNYPSTGTLYNLTGPNIQDIVAIITVK